MERRELLGLMGIGAAGLLASGTTRAAAAFDDEKGHHHENDDPKRIKHLDVMAACVAACNETAHHCLEQLASDKTENRKQHAAIHELAMDCQAICYLTRSMMARYSPLTKTMHAACAEACAACATECEKEQSEVTKKCAEVCRACEKLCRECCAA